MHALSGFLAGACSLLLASQPAAGADSTAGITLQIPAGVPMRLYLTKPVSKRLGAPVEGKVLEPLFAFDREVVPAGSAVSGKVSRVEPVTKWLRFRAIINGDFTPLRNAWIEFDTLTRPDGSTLPLHTVETQALNSIYIEPSKKPQKPKKSRQAKQKPAPANGGIIQTARQTARDQINGAINARSRGIAGIVRGPNKKEKLVDFLWTKLPYHPQNVRRGTRFDSPLGEALAFGAEPVNPLVDWASLGTQPAADTVARVRLVAGLDSASAKQGEPVEAVLAAPLFSAEGHHLVLPEGTRLIGAVTLARKARSFHRGGRLRFNFQRIELPPEVAALREQQQQLELRQAAAQGAQAAPLKQLLAARPTSTQAILDSAEPGGNSRIKVNSEGAVEAQESKTRFIAPLISLMLAHRAADNDAGHHHGIGTATGGADANISGRTLGGLSGFGLAGAAIARSSKYVGMGFGYYGLAWSVYSNVIARGGEVQFEKNAMMEIRFGARPAPVVPKSKFRDGAAAVAGGGGAGE